MCEFVSFAIGITKANHEKIYLGNLFSHSGLEAQHGLRPDTYAEADWTEKGLSIRTAGRSEYDNEALLRASILGRWPTREAFLEYCYATVNLDARDADGRTPLYAAICNGQEALALALIDRGADVNASNNEGWRPLLAAAGYGRVTIALALTNKGAKLNIQNACGQTID